MAHADYSLEVLRRLEAGIDAQGLHRPRRVSRYEAGDELSYDVTGVVARVSGRVRLGVEKFVGGGFAGQVYRVKVLEITPEPVPSDAEGPSSPAQPTIAGLSPGSVCALKILVPPSSFSLVFRNALYWLGFQGPFQLQVNPAAARAGALWQTIIRRAAKLRFGDEGAVVAVHATLVDERIGSCGELSEWVEGRTWRLECDERLDQLARWSSGLPTEPGALGSPEYRAKKTFMRQFVQLLHEVGAHEFARQYEWSTWKSQPNCLKRTETDAAPEKGLVAVDFRAGLALLPFLPMSPGDFKLIPQGIWRGSLVQFDRGDLKKLAQFIDAHAELADLKPLLEELQGVERVYRESLFDVTHHGPRVLYSRVLWGTILDSSVTGWKVQGLVDGEAEKALRQSRFKTLLFGLLGFLPLLGRLLRRLWCRPDWRKHYGAMLKSLGYLARAVRGRVGETVVGWHRAGRVDAAHAEPVATHLWRFLLQLPLAVLPAKIHRALTDWAYFKHQLDYLCVRPFRLYFDARTREQWMLDMVEEGKRGRMLTPEDEGIIRSQLGEPFIQKYLKSLAVHVLFMPTTHVVAVVLAIFYVWKHPEMPRAQAWAVGFGIVALFQVIPISPGSIARGLYVVWLVVKERNFKDYNLALVLAFFKYVGYLAFPIQMTQRYPALARFMAGYWSTGFVHLIPVFGEPGALLERKVFSLFYNWPLTLRRRVRLRGEARRQIPARAWHIPLVAVAGAALFALAEQALARDGRVAELRSLWWAVISLPSLVGVAVTLGAGGAPLGRRVAAAALGGLAMAIAAALFSFALASRMGTAQADLAISWLWQAFLFTLMATVAAVVTEVALPEPPAGASQASG